MSPLLRTALLAAFLAASAPHAATQEPVAALSARGQIDRVFYREAGGARVSVGAPGAVGHDVLNLEPGTQVWVDNGAEASAVIVYAPSGRRVALGPGGRHRVGPAEPDAPQKLLTVLGEAARSLVAMLGRRAEGPEATGFNHNLSRGARGPVVVLTDAGRPWPLLPGAAPLAWDGKESGRRGDVVRLWSGVSDADCTGGDLASESSPYADGVRSRPSRPVFTGRALLVPDVPYRIDLVGADGAARASACVRVANPSRAEGTGRDVRLLERAVEVGPATSAGGPGVHREADLLVAALLAERGFVPDALLRLDGALASAPDDVGAGRLRDAIRASHPAP